MAREIESWITVNGQHIPIYKGMTKQEAIDLQTKDKKRVDEDEDKKQKQIEANKKEADEKNSENTNQVNTMIKNEEYSKLGNFLAQHREEFGLKKSEDAHMVAYDVISGNRTLKNTLSQKEKGNKEDNKKSFSESNIKYAPDKNDVVNPKDYFKDTSVQVNESLSDWKKEVDKKGIPSVVQNYMDDSSINEKLRSGGLDQDDMRMAHQLDTFTKRDTVKKGTILYSGLTSDEL